jgi:hypothetical protein
LEKTKALDFYLRPGSYIALCTLPDRKQRLQTYIFLTVPSAITLTRCTFGFHWRLVLIWEWLYFLPKVTLFPQISHFAINSAPSQSSALKYFTRRTGKGQEAGINIGL